MPNPDFRLQLPDGSTFQASGNMQLTHDQETMFVFDGFRNSLALFEQFVEDGGQEEAGDGMKQGVFLGSGAGVSRIDVRFVQHEGSTEQWGDSDPDDSARSKLQTLDYALKNVRISSDNPATLEVGEYSAEGKFNPIPVIVKQSNLTVDYESRSSSFTGNMQFYESSDLFGTVHGSQQTED